MHRRVNLYSIRPEKGVIPKRPTYLRRPSVVEASSRDDAVIELLQNGKIAVYGGISLLGEFGTIVCKIGFLQLKDEILRGWLLAINHPEEETANFKYVDTSSAPLTEIPFPDTIVYFAGEADESLIAPDASLEELKSVARFILPFISDEGPPDGIDW